RHPKCSCHSSPRGSTGDAQRRFQRPTHVQNPIERCYNTLTMQLTRDEVLHIAELARLGLSDGEVARMQEQLSDILSHAERLQQVELSHISPSARVQDLQSVMRDDEVQPSFPREAMLANAPQAAEGCFRVPPVLE
ncbi:MAG: Asp-tRNA(Asn)/Glu-tRNA(Gln) amidotransferase subunit GatC, partial [Chloroflexi bacterium]|nr:Asp-tRNA(Asn)/Glu-tRNA(Gln) amidotransferase subunit GatC [Chloroflexota bacterium]